MKRQCNKYPSLILIIKIALKEHLKSEFVSICALNATCADAEKITSPNDCSGVNRSREEGSYTRLKKSLSTESLLPMLAVSSSEIYDGVMLRASRWVRYPF